ncbi:hypothetical protein [Burkholderia sp. Bp8990]|uniref:hypothetical protein n=1 Tax=Burkholderia sp. Bp8990 TaxID=2184552 RepID=UPI000F590CA2|nr:hypothetical protein [Burkholderia sp. Bp8990]RQS39786.1 hypothetical protein DIE01_16375 [Burkholderia sp. Bp8990]
MSGLSNVINAAAGAINGYRDQQYRQNEQDYLQAARADQELKMQAAQSTYEPQAQAAIAQAGLSAAQANGSASLVPQQTQLASTDLSNRQGFSSAQHEMLPTTLADLKAKGFLDDQTMHVSALNGLYNSMLSGPDAVKQYVSNIAGTGLYPNLAGKQIGQVGLSQDGQTFVAQDTDGNQIFSLPVAAIQQAHQMAVPTEWHAVGDSLIGTQGGRVTAQQSTTKFNALRPGETGVVTQGGQIMSSTQAPVPQEFSGMHDSALVKNAKWIAANVTNGDTTKALSLAQQANSMSKAQFIAMALPNMMTIGNMQPNDAVNKLSQAYDAIRGQDATPGLSNAPGSNSSGNTIIDSLINGPGGAPGSSVTNPYQEK